MIIYNSFLYNTHWNSLSIFLTDDIDRDILVYFYLISASILFLSSITIEYTRLHNDNVYTYAPSLTRCKCHHKSKWVTMWYIPPNCYMFSPNTKNSENSKHPLIWETCKGTKPLPEPILAYYYWRSVAFILAQFGSGCLAHYFVWWVWKLHFWNHCHISQGQLIKHNSYALMKNVTFAFENFIF